MTACPVRFAIDEDVGHFAFGDCPVLNSVIFWPRVSSAFIAWSVSNSHNRANWQLTTLKRLCSVLGLITAFALERRDVPSVDPDGSKHVFLVQTLNFALF